MKRRILALLCLLTLVLPLAACREEKLPPSDSAYTYETTPIALHDSGLNPKVSDMLFLLRNGSIGLRRFVVQANRVNYFHYYILGEDGKLAPVMDGSEYYRFALETDEHQIILTDNKGKTVLYDENWNPIKELPSLYDGYSIDAGRYFAFNDTFMTDYDSLEPEAKDVKPELFALYRYTEKLSECIYTTIEECPEGYVGYYTAEDGTTKEHYFFVNDQVSRDLFEINTTINAETGKYEVLDWGGNNVLGTSFDYATNIVNNRMLIRVGEEYFMAQIEKAK